jgi:hypothetical protein
MELVLLNNQLLEPKGRQSSLHKRTIFETGIMEVISHDEVRQKGVNRVGILSSKTKCQVITRIGMNSFVRCIQSL